LVASFILEDEGEYWRRAMKRELSPMAHLIGQWVAERRTSPSWQIPV
jgi:hypothetical protein